MSIAKNSKSSKQKLGEFFTPINLAKTITDSINIEKTDIILEPSFGEGSFLIPIIDRFLSFGVSIEEIFETRLYGVEYNKKTYDTCLGILAEKYGELPKKHNLVCSDFFAFNFNTTFDKIIGNPPFGGTFDKNIEAKLEKEFGNRNGMKIKKETYSFFIVKCIELISSYDGGSLYFICSDTFLTINTMKGLRYFLQKSGTNKITNLNYFSEETNYPMVVLEHHMGLTNDVIVDDITVLISDINSTPNLSWRINQELSQYFGTGCLLKDIITASSGMTVGKNAFFVREIADNKIVEVYEHCIQPNSVKTTEIPPTTIELPDTRYCNYNKATKGYVYKEPSHVIFWENDGEAVYKFKKSGPSYLHGIGGKKFFKREGITWNLISEDIKAKYLPAGFILDSGAPIAVLNNGIDSDELFFVLGWLLSETANKILKGVLNHTKNIQGKDIERLPYPSWVNTEVKNKIINEMKILVSNQTELTKEEISKIGLLDNFNINEH